MVSKSLYGPAAREFFERQQALRRRIQLLLEDDEEVEAVVEAELLPEPPLGPKTVERPEPEPALPPEAQSEKHLFALRIIAGADSGPGTAYELGQGETTIGRKLGSGIRLFDNSVSHAHAVISVLKDKVTIRDTNSTNGTKVNDHYIELPTDLSVGDTIVLGDAVLVLEAAGGEE